MGLFNGDYICSSCGREYKGLEEGHLLFSDRECNIFKCNFCKNLFSYYGEGSVCPKCGCNADKWDYTCPECGSKTIYRGNYISD